MEYRSSRETVAQKQFLTMTSQEERRYWTQPYVGFAYGCPPTYLLRHLCINVCVLHTLSHTHAHTITHTHTHKHTNTLSHTQTHTITHTHSHTHKQTLTNKKSRYATCIRAGVCQMYPVTGCCL